MSPAGSPRSICTDGARHSEFVPNGFELTLGNAPFERTRFDLSFNLPPPQHWADALDPCAALCFDELVDVRFDCAAAHLVQARTHWLRLFARAVGVRRVEAAGLLTAASLLECLATLQEAAGGADSASTPRGTPVLFPKLETLVITSLKPGQIEGWPQPLLSVLSLRRLKRCPIRTIVLEKSLVEAYPLEQSTLSDAELIVLAW